MDDKGSGGNEERVGPEVARAATSSVLRLPPLGSVRVVFKDLDVVAAVLGAAPRVKAHLDAIMRVWNVHGPILSHVVSIIVRCLHHNGTFHAFVLA